MSETRRTWLKTVAFGSVPILCKWNAGADADALRGTQSVVLPIPFQPQSSLDDALEAPVSTFFGILPDQSSKQPGSFYSTKSAMPERLSFDISNNFIQCSINRAGVLDRLCILTGVLPAETLTSPFRGVFASKELIRGGPWSFRLRLQGSEPVSLGEFNGTRVDLLGNMFPMFTSLFHDLRVRLLFFAPVAVDASSVAPRGVIVVVQVKNEGPRATSGAALAPAELKDVAGLNAGRNPSGSAAGRIKVAAEFPRGPF